MNKAFYWYNIHSEQVSDRYETIYAHKIHSWLEDLLPPLPASVLDVGSGSGRDAAWLADQGFNVVAVEPSAQMMKLAKQKHPTSSIRWIDDAMPSLDKLSKSGATFEFILLSAVWMHLPKKERPRAFRKLINLLKPGGVLAITLRISKPDPERSIYAVNKEEIESLARGHGAFIERCITEEDQFGRKDIKWIKIAIRLPDDGTGALPLLRHVILNDNKSSTYKLALLCCLSRIATSSAGMVREYDDHTVAIPLGLVALTWIRIFKPLLVAKLPQSPSNIGYDRLGFVKEGFRRLEKVSHLDLKVGSVFSSRETIVALHAAIKDAIETITRMPATYMKYPNGNAILPVIRTVGILRPDRIVLDETYLSSFGEMQIPRHLWRSFQRFDVWIEPAIVSEWSNLIKRYLKKQDRKVSELAIMNAMIWDDPSRDVKIAREQAIRLANQEQLYCVWSGQLLTMKSVNMDHCLPWSVWPCGDLWNLLPVLEKVNKYEKRAKLPSDRLLNSAKDRMFDWWQNAYQTEHQQLEERFWLEATASLPYSKTEQSLDNLFEALCFQRFKLKSDQQIPEWQGEKYLS